MATADPVYDPALTGATASITKTRTVLGAPAQTIAYTVLNAENNGLIRIRGRFRNVNAGTATIVVQINGAATNIGHQATLCVGGAVSGITTGLFTINTGKVAVFELDIYTAKDAGAFVRGGSGTAQSASGANAITWNSAFIYNDTTTTITSITFDSQLAGALDTGSEITVTEEARS